VFAYDDALSHLRSALPIAEAHDHHGSQRAGVLLRLGRIEVFFENRDQGVAHLEIALKMYEQIGDDQRAGEIHSHLGRVFGSFGPQENVARALVHLQRAEFLLGQTGEGFALGLVYWGLAFTNMEALRINEALTASQKGMDIFARLGERERWARVAGKPRRTLNGEGETRAGSRSARRNSRGGSGFRESGCLSARDRVLWLVSVTHERSEGGCAFLPARF